MKMEIYARGPITYIFHNLIHTNINNSKQRCGLFSTPTFENWKGWDIYSEKIPVLLLDHVVSIVGWGRD